eukprot:TRINITY_DN36489_c0_g1_i2.p1 TRINITY_DN36489_c0_g1~~TRINITY_DN36489_c0_g1_i2.p1  ORF type:complete len:108 (-),score=3.02 TRINITY_DN36489_c0_g1_i2:7-330(-)
MANTFSQYSFHFKLLSLSQECQLFYQKQLSQQYQKCQDLFLQFFSIFDSLLQQYLSLIHISEPTRLGMISYAVFCLKKKKHNNESQYYLKHPLIKQNRAYNICSKRS